MMYTINLSSMRCLRWTIMVPILIYVPLLFIKLRNILPFTEKSNHNNRFEELMYELEGATVGPIMQKEFARFKFAKLTANDQPIAEVQMDIREDSQNLLEDIFVRADLDGNSLLDIQELSRWIHAKITDHISQATKENYGLFMAVDIHPSDGQITWDEYHAYFLRKHGFSEFYITSHNKRHVELSRTLKEIIMRDKARWSEAARNDPEKLTLDEFLAFTHPESSDKALLQMVEELLDKFDRDADEFLTEDEFASLPLNGFEIPDKQAHFGANEDRRKEFRYLIDKNKDGKANRSELLMYIDPRNPRHAIQEAQHLIELSDLNNDSKLNLPEILSKMDLFLGSKMVDTEKSFHDEFR